MKKIISVFVLSMLIGASTLAYFQPATLTNGVKKVAVYTESQAKALFNRGYVLDGEKSIGAVSGTRVTTDMEFLGQVKMRNQVANIAKTNISATTTLLTKDSGTTYYLSASGTTINLPFATSSKGVYYRFVVKGALDTGNVMITSRAGDDIDGTLIVAGAVVDCDAVDAINFIVDGENVGDYVEVYSDGTKWFIGDSGVLTTAKMTCTG